MAETRRKASLNFVYKISAEFIARFSLFFFYLSMTHNLGVESYGLYTKFYSYFSLLLIINDLGLNLIFARNVNQSPELFHSYFSKIFRFKFFLLGVYTVLCLLLSSFIEFTPDQLFLVILMIVYLGTYNLYESFLYALIGTDQLKQEGIVKSANRISSAVIGIGMILFFHSLNYAILSHIFINLVSIVFIIVLLQKSSVYKSEIRSSSAVSIYKTLKESLPIAILTFLMLVYLRIDIIMLDYFIGETKIIGLYGVIVKINEMMQIAPSMIIAALFPIINNLYKENKEKMLLIIHKTLKLCLIIALSCSIGGFFLANDFIPFVFGNEFEPAGAYGRILFWSFIPFSISIVLLNLSLVYGKQVNNMFATIASVCINIGLNLIFIPKWGAVGASVATVAAELILSITIVLLSRKFFVINWKSLNLLNIIFPFLVFSASLYGLQEMEFHFILNGIISTSVLIILLFIFGGVSKEEKEMIFEMTGVKK